MPATVATVVALVAAAVLAVAGISAAMLVRQRTRRRGSLPLEVVLNLIRHDTALRLLYAHTRRRYTWWQDAEPDERSTIDRELSTWDLIARRIVRGGGDRSEVLEVFRWRLVDTWELAYPYVQMRRVEQPGLWSALDDLYVDAYEAVYAGPKPGRHEPATRERALRPLDRAVSPEEVPEGPADMTALTGRPTPHGAPVAAAPEREPPRAEPAAASPTPVPAAPPVAAPATPTPAVEPAATTPAAPPADDVPAGPPERSTKRAAPSPIVGRRLLLDARSGGFSVDIASEAPPVRNRLIDLRGALSDVDPAPPADVDPRPAASPRPPGAAQAFEEVIDVDPRPSPTGYPPGS